MRTAGPRQHMQVKMLRYRQDSHSAIFRDSISYSFASLCMLSARNFRIRQQMAAAAEFLFCRFLNSRQKWLLVHVSASASAPSAPTTTTLRHSRSLPRNLASTSATEPCLSRPAQENRRRQCQHRGTLRHLRDVRLHHLSTST
jgi:hypothetical protein